MKIRITRAGSSRSRSPTRASSRISWTRTSTRSSLPARTRADLPVAAPEAVDVLVRSHEPELAPGQTLQVEIVALQPLDLPVQVLVALEEREGGVSERPPFRAEMQEVRDAV